MLNKRTSQIGTISNSTTDFPNLTGYRGDTIGPEIRKIRAGYICPEVFNRIKFGRIRRQIFSCQPFSLFHNIFLRTFTSMRRKPIPNKYHLFLKMFSQTAYKYFYLSTLYCSGQKPHEKANSFTRNISCQNRNSRKSFPIICSNNYGRLSFWCPCSSDRRSFGKTAFVEKNQGSSYSLGFFLIQVHLYLRHLRTASSFFSLACLSGFWQLQPIEPRSFHMCPGWYST